MKNSLKLLCLGLLAFLIFLLITAPAPLLTKPLSKHSSVKFEQVAGSLWKGQAKQVHIEGIPIGAVAWDIHLTKLFAGQLAVTLLLGGTNNSDLNGNIELSLRLPGELVIEQSHLQATAEWVVVQAELPIVPKGHVTLDIDQLYLQDKKLPKVNAKLRWLNAGVTYPNTYELGAYHVSLNHEPAEQPKKIVGKIHDIDSPLHVVGSLNIDNQGRYNLDVNVSAESYAPADISQVLPFLGRKNADGSVNIQRDGSIQAFF